jgi:regulation of enolase protein 1 (concanavalin A-like superfamily)
MIPGTRTAAAEQLCDPAFQDCRAPLLDLINNETVGIDVAFWFMEDDRYAQAIIARWHAGVPVRVLMDTEANASYPTNATIVSELAAAGIPMRNKSGGTGILHWKTMLFVGQDTVEFSGANYSAEAFVPLTPYSNYVDEVIYFSDDPAVVDSFKTRYDDCWTDTTGVFTNYANTTTLVRNYPTYPLDPEMNFVPWNDFATRSVNAYKAENQSIDAIMYRITDKRHTDQMIAAVQRGVPVRLITEPNEYRDPNRLWDSYNVDLMYVNGVQVRIREHQGLSHEKLTLLNGQEMAIFGSSNWSSASAEDQHEHNIFTTKSWFYLWAVDHFNRKWNNLGPSPETTSFTPLPPDAPTVKAPANGSSEQPLSVTLTWYGGPWSHRYDVYFGTDPNNLTKIVSDVYLGPSATTSSYQTHTVSNLAQSTTYYWQVVDRTMANLETRGPVWSFRTQGAAPSLNASDVVLWAWHSNNHPGWQVTSDTTAAGGNRLANTDAGTKASSPLASPSMYFDLGFNADAGGPYRIWIRGKATRNDYSNDSVYVQFSDSVDSTGTPIWTVGTTSATAVTIEDCFGCGLAGWGWNDNATTSTPGALGQAFYLQNSGAHSIRVQVREDGLSIDQIVISKDTFASTAPGYPKNDGTIYSEQNAAALPPPSTPPPSPLPSGWSDSDIGGPSPAGSATYSNGVYTVVGAGSDIWGTADQFHFAYTPLTGDGTIVARVATLQYVADWTKAGVMMRESLSGGSAQALMLVSANKGLAFQRRTVTGGSSTNTAGPFAKAPYWVKLVRSGSTVSAYYSATGASWTLVGSDSFSMAATIYVGLAVSSHLNGTLAQATFDNVSVQSGGTTPTPPPPAVPSPWTAGDIGSVAPPGSASFDSTSGTFTVQGSGADIWGSADAFQFVSQPLSGDGEIVAHVKSVQYVSGWTKAGVMMRDTLDANSAHGLMLVSPGKGTAFQRRTSAGGLSTNTAGPATTAPYWVKLTRFGTSITAYVSSDGTSWTQVGTDTIAMGDTIDVGLAVTSHSNGTLATATFDQVTVTKY